MNCPRYVRINDGFSVTTVNTLIEVLTKLADQGFGDHDAQIFDPDSGEWESVTGLVYGDGDGTVRLYSDAE